MSPRAWLSLVTYGSGAWAALLACWALATALMR